MADRIAEQRVIPFQFADDLLGIRIEQQFVRIEAMSRGRLVRPVHAIAVKLPRPRVGQIAVPHLVGVLGQRDALGLAAGVVEKTQFHLGGVRGKQREVDAQAIPRRAERIGQTFAYPGGLMRRMRRGVVERGGAHAGLRASRRWG